MRLMVARDVPENGVGFQRCESWAGASGAASPTWMTAKPAAGSRPRADAPKAPPPAPSQLCWLGRGAAPLRSNDALLEQGREDAGGVEAREAGEGEEVLVADGAVDLCQEEAGAVVEVQPHHLLRLDREPGDAVARSERRLVLLQVVPRLEVRRIELQDLLDHLERAREVAQREELARALQPHLHLAPRLLLEHGRGLAARLRDERAQVRLLGDRGEVQSHALAEDDRRRERRADVPWRRRVAGEGRALLLPGRGWGVIPGRGGRNAWGRGRGPRRVQSRAFGRRQRDGRPHPGRGGRRGERDWRRGRRGRRDPRCGSGAAGRGQRDGRALRDGGRRALPRDELEVGARALVPGFELEHLAPGALRVVELAARVGADPEIHELPGRHVWPSPALPPASPLKSWRVRSSCSSRPPSCAPSRAAMLARARCTTASAFWTASFPKRLLASAAVTAGTSASIPAMSLSAVSRRRSKSETTCFFSSSSSRFSSMIRFSSSSVRPEVAVTVMDWRCPVMRSRAETPTMPSAVMSNVTSTSMSPRRAGRSPGSTNSPRSSFSIAFSLAPCRTAMRTAAWLS